MDDDLHRRLTTEGDYFAPQDHFRLVRIESGTTQDSRSPGFDVRIAAEKEVAAWVTQSVDAQEEPTASGIDGGPPASLRMIIGSPRVLEQNIWPLPFSNETCKRVFHAWGVPQFFLRAILRHIPIATTFSPQRLPAACSGLLLRTNLSVAWQYGLSVVHDAGRNRTCCILLGLSAAEIKMFLASLQSVVQRRHAEILSYHVLVPMILMDIALDTLSQDAERRRGELLQIYQATGLHGFRNLDRKTSKEEGQLELDLLTKLTHKLTALSDGCAGIKAVCKMQFRFVEALRLFSASGYPKRDARVAADLTMTFPRVCEEQVHFIEQILHGVESKIGYTQESAQCQVQTMYSLIEQRESRTHIEYADTSSRIAAQNQKIAELTRRDSIDMRIVATVTLLFLPGTFTATLFSATFFNFQPTSSSHVSPWIWLYGTLTTVLTALVLLGWWYFAKQQNQKTEVAFRRETWRHGLKGLGGRGQPSVVHLSEEAMKTRPYLSGSIAGFNGLVIANGDEGDVFAQEVPLGDVSPKNTYW